MTTWLDVRNDDIVVRLHRGVETYEQIGQRFGLSRERVRQIGRNAGIDRNHQYPPNRPRSIRGNDCRECGQRIPQGQMRSHRTFAGHAFKHGTKMNLPKLLLIREFYERGLGYSAIAQVMGCKFPLVKYHLIRAGVIPRKGREAGIPTAALRAELAERWARLEEKS